MFFHLLYAHFVSATNERISEVETNYIHSSLSLFQEKRNGNTNGLQHHS